MNIEYAAAMPRRRGLLANPDGRVAVVEHALARDSLKSLCGDLKQNLEVLHHIWNPVSPTSCTRCLRRYHRLVK